MIAEPWTVLVYIKVDGWFQVNLGFKLKIILCSYFKELVTCPDNKIIHGALKCVEFTSPDLLVSHLANNAGRYLYYVFIQMLLQLTEWCKTKG